MKTIDEMTGQEVLDATLRGLAEVARQFERRDASELEHGDETSRRELVSPRDPIDP